MKSQKRCGGGVEYRTKRMPISKGLYSEYDQYFCKDIIKLKDNEVFVDGGAYRGDTIQQFIDNCRKKNISYKKIIAFEPDSHNFNLLSKFYGKRKDILLIKRGLSKDRDVLYFQGNSVNFCKAESKEKSSCQVSVVNIDAVPECRDATFIKMDIEGAEMDALYGAKETIKKNHPKLAICIYHSDEDMIQIIEYVHSLVSEYKLYVRHHTRGKCETVLYAVV